MQRHGRACRCSAGLQDQRLLDLSEKPTRNTFSIGPPASGPAGPAVCFGLTITEHVRWQKIYRNLIWKRQSGS